MSQEWYENLAITAIVTLKNIKNKVAETSWYVVCNPTYVTKLLVSQEYSLEDLAQACADTKELCYVDREKTEVIPLHHLTEDDDNK